MDQSRRGRVQEVPPGTRGGGLAALLAFAYFAFGDSDKGRQNLCDFIA